MIKNFYVQILVAGGTIMTNRVDYLEAAIIARGALLQGWESSILNWTPAAGKMWTDRFQRGECTIARIAPGGKRVMALVPFGIPITLASGEVVRFESGNAPVVPQGIEEWDHPDFTPPDPYGFARESNDAE